MGIRRSEFLDWSNVLDDMDGGDWAAGWPRAVTHPRLPQFRTCPTKASGSSNDGLAAQRYTLCTTRVWGKG